MHPPGLDADYLLALQLQEEDSLPRRPSSFSAAATASPAPPPVVVTEAVREEQQRQQQQQDRLAAVALERAFKVEDSAPRETPRKEKRESRGACVTT